MFENMTAKQKSILSWVIFVVLILVVGFISYYFLSNKALDRNVNNCLEEFKVSYDKYSLIYEYDISCKELFSKESNSVYCDSLADKDFCLYSFANFIKDKAVSTELCSQISDLKLKNNCLL